MSSSLGSSGNSISSDPGSAETVAATFRDLGGVFLTPPLEILERLARVRALVFDWDGVFNPGTKGEGSSSTFSEADSMGVNLLRFALWRRDGRVPVAAVITGEHNASAHRFATRENFHVLYQGVKNKTAALEELCVSHRLSRSELLCVFDDVNDLGMAHDCGLRILVRRASSPLLQRYVREFGSADYVTAFEPARHALREFSELLLGLMRVFAIVVHARIAFDAEYSAYWAERQTITTELLGR
jgi:3-deoxy-D-manno-octulosonate 8-phosphate phosphatase (KDO 8-P phosphatase)